MIFGCFAKKNTIMKRLLCFCLALLTVSGSLFAQNEDRTGMEWVLEEGVERVQFDPNYQGITVYSDGWEPFTDWMGYSVYGSRYRKAKRDISNGSFLVYSSVPLAIALATWGLTVHGDGSQEAVAAIGTAAVLGAGLGFGIPLWRRGQREMDWMLDDYSRRYGPKPYSSTLSVGPTSGGIGLALNF